jgi:hypothetical protein
VIKFTNGLRFAAYFGGTTLKTTIPEMTMAGIIQIMPAKNKSTPELPSAAGTENPIANVKRIQIILIHQTGSNSVPQKGQLVSGGLLPKGLCAKSRPHFGQPDHSLLVALLVASVGMVTF